MSQTPPVQGLGSNLGVEIRVAEAADEAFLREMLYHSLHVPVGEAPFPKEVLEAPEIARYVQGWGRPGDLGLIADESTSGTAIGAVWMRRFDESEAGYGFVSSDVPELAMAVLPGHRGRGVGSALLHRLLEDVSTLHPAVSLSVAADNPARRLYERCGFEIVGSDGSSLTMAKPL